MKARLRSVGYDADDKSSTRSRHFCTIRSRFRSQDLPGPSTLRATPQKKKEQQKTKQKQTQNKCSKNVLKIEIREFSITLGHEMSVLLTPKNQRAYSNKWLFAVYKKIFLTKQTGTDKAIKHPRTWVFCCGYTKQ